MDKKLMANPDIVLRTEYDDWGILFDPNTGKTQGISPVGIFIWQMLNGTHTKEEILAALNKACDDGIPEQAAKDYDDFITSLQEKGYVSL